MFPFSSSKESYLCQQFCSKSDKTGYISCHPVLPNESYACCRKFPGLGGCDTHVDDILVGYVAGADLTGQTCQQWSSNFSTLCTCKEVLSGIFWAITEPTARRWNLSKSMKALLSWEEILNHLFNRRSGEEVHVNGN